MLLLAHLRYSLADCKPNVNTLIDIIWLNKAIFNTINTLILSHSMTLCPESPKIA